VIAAQTPASKARVIAELKEELTTVNQEIKEMQRSRSVDVEQLEEKICIRDVIETSLEKLEEQDN